MRDFIYKKARESTQCLVEKIFEITRDFSGVEAEGLAKQIQEAAVSIATSLAAGEILDDEELFAGFLLFVIGTTHKLEALLSLASKLGHLGKTECKNLSLEIEEIRCLLKTSIWHIDFASVSNENGD
ncbi:MAG: four helix bundle protein [Chloroflexi bacterium]|nr:four helix bundle protein [Chloroflexota bacterium]